MRLFIFTFLIVCSLSGNLFAQPINWSPVPIPDLAYNPRSLYYSENFDFTVYGGLFYQSPGLYYLGAYNGEEWEVLVDSLRGDVWCAVDYNNGILVGGTTVSSDSSLKRIGYYDGVNWTYPWEFNAAVKNLVWTNDTLFALGDFTEIDGEPIYEIAKLVNGLWKPVVLYDEENMDFVGYNDIEYYNGSYYVGGNIELLDGPDDLARIEDMQLHHVGSGLVGSWVMVGDLQVYNGELYVSGIIPFSQGNVGNMIVRWDGEVLSNVGDYMYYTQGSFGIEGGVSHMFARNGYLYCVGSFNYIGNTPISGVARWDGMKWCGLWANSLLVGPPSQQIIAAEGYFQDKLMIMRYYPYSDGAYDVFWLFEGGDEVEICTEPTSVSEIQNIDFEIYPNPVSGNIKSIRIRSNSGRSGLMSIYTSDARLIREDVRFDGNSLVPLPDLAPGIYVLSFEYGQKKVSKKLAIL